MKIITSNELDEIQKVKYYFCFVLDITKLILLYFLSNQWLCVSQNKYAKNLTENFKMVDCKSENKTMEIGLKLSTTTDPKPTNELAHRHLVGSLIHLTATKVKPELCIQLHFQIYDSP